MVRHNTHCIGLMGYPGAGKSYGSDIIADEFEIPAVAIGDVVRSRAEDALGPDADSDDIGEWVTSQLNKDKRAINNWVVDHLHEMPDSDYAVIDGIRTPSDVEVFRDEFDEFSLVYVRAMKQTRLERLQSRGRDGEEDFTMDDLDRRDSREDDWGVGTIIDECLHDAEVGNDLPHKFEQKLLGTVHALLANIAP